MGHKRANKEITKQYEMSATSQIRTFYKYDRGENKSIRVDLICNDQLSFTPINILHKKKEK